MDNRSELKSMELMILGHISKMPEEEKQAVMDMVKELKEVHSRYKENTANTALALYQCEVGLAQ